MYRTIVLGVALALLAPLAWTSARALFQNGEPGPITSPADFRAFYCAARTAAAGDDPYRTEPLRTCEQAAARRFGLRMFDGLVLPAPLPPYALALLVPLGRLDFGVASSAWLGLSLIALAGSALLLARLATWPPGATALVLAGPLAFVSLPLGQTMPLVVALLCGAALALRAGRSPLAAACCALATLEPHVALPACVALALFCRRARTTLLLCGVVAVAASACFAGPPALAEYALQVLPLHALSQVGDFAIQYSLTALVRALGASQAVALLTGSLSYVAFAGTGIFVARRLALRFGDEAFLVLVPPAFAVIGGTFVHLAQIAIAIPALVLLIARLQPRSASRRFALVALVALAIPWGSVADTAPLAGLLWRHAIPPRAVVLPQPSAATFAEQTETAFLLGGGYGSNGASVLALALFKVPTWCGLLAFAGLAARAARNAR